MTTLKIEHGALTEAPVYEDHRRGKNWFAKIAVDPASPGGFSREFARRANGDFIYIVPPWAVPGTPVEFGADYYSARGAKTPRRFYGVVVAVNPDGLTVEKCETGREACKKAEARRSDIPDEYQGGTAP